VSGDFPQPTRRGALTVGKFDNSGSFAYLYNIYLVEKYHTNFFGMPLASRGAGAWRHLVNDLM
jgi:hypothetical protein